MGMWPSGRASVLTTPHVAAVQEEDDALVTRVQQGDEVALGSLLDRYGATVLNIGYRVLRDSGEAQELVQDVFLHIYRKCHLYDHARGSFRGWLIQIASHRAFDRREYLNLHRFYDHRNLDDLPEILSDLGDMEGQLEDRQRDAKLRQTFNDLSDKQRATLELYFFEGYTLREVSERLNDSLANVRHYYYRALERLKKRYMNSMASDGGQDKNHD